MRVVYLSSFGLIKDQNGEITSPIASSRYRILLPGQVLSRLGFDVHINVLTDDHLRDAERAAAAVQADLVIVAKLIDARAVAVIAALKKRGIPIIVDYCDNHFDHPDLGGLYRGLAGLADRVVVNSEAMVDVVRKATGRDAVAIFDPVEGRRNEARYAPSLPAIKCVWYGFAGNLPYLFDRLSKWMGQKQEFPLTVEIITEPSPDVNAVISSFNGQYGQRCRLSFRPWSVAAVTEAIARTDVVLIPSELNESTRPKSANRLMEAIYGGRLALATMLPSYNEFAPYCRDDSDIGFLSRALQAREDVSRAIAAGQDHIERRYLPLHAGLFWSNVIRGSADLPPMKLNLGCGDKILPGYINVDIVSSRAGFTPDVQCDLRRLSPFADASVDEILSVHVVEHFWRWEVRDILTEWKRVLKPGGRIVLECPNLESACKTFLADPVSGSAESELGQRTMWVFYGDPQWRDPLMVHRWGYTPESLKALLTACGFANVRQEPAQYKLREPRDMRVVGEKPAGRSEDAFGLEGAGPRYKTTVSWN